MQPRVRTTGAALWTIVLAAFSAGRVAAQEVPVNIAGIWQGIITPSPPAKALRIVFNVAAAATDATMYSIDQTGTGFMCTVQLRGSNLEITVGKVGGIYKGRLEPDGNSITGTWM